MIQHIIQLLFPNYYRRVWNQAFIDGMEKTRKELYEEFPNNHDLIDLKISQVYKDRLMK